MHLATNVMFRFAEIAGSVALIAAAPYSLLPYLAMILPYLAMKASGIGREMPENEHHRFLSPDLRDYRYT